jgi:hypothetical protein
MTNSFGRKIKNVFSLTFKKDEEKIKLFLNEQVCPSAYIKDLIVQDMLKQSKNNVVDDYKIEVNNETEDISGFDFSLED